MNRKHDNNNKNKFVTVLLFFICIFSSSSILLAQPNLDCVDTSRINDYYICGNPTYQPVCGCNGITYRNDCRAYFAGGVNYWVSGTCENFGFDILTNPTGLELTLSVYTKKSGLVNVQVYSSFGTLVAENAFTSAQESVQQFFISTDGFESDTYVILVFLNGEQQAKKAVIMGNIY